MPYPVTSNGSTVQGERPNRFAKYVPASAPGKMRVTGPDGIVVNFPEGTDHATIDRVMHEAMAKSKPNRFQHLIPKSTNADLPTVERAFMNAHKAGDTKAAGVLAAEVRRLREAAPEGSSNRAASGERSFLITAPDGKKYKVTGENQEGALQALQQHLGSATNAETDPRFEGSARNPTAGKRDRGETDFNSALYNPVVEGVTLSAADEVLSGISAPINAVLNKYRGGPQGVSENYQQTRAQYERDKAYIQEQHPIATTVGELAGGLATGKLPAGLIARGGNMINKIAKGAAVGAGYGAVQGFNSGDGLDDRLTGGAHGAEVGAIVGGAMAPVAQGIGKDYHVLASRFGSDIRKVAREAGVKPKVFRQVAKAYGDDAETGMLNQADDADMLLNSGPQLQAFAENIASQPGQGRSLLIRAIGEQSRGAGPRTADVVNRTLGHDAGRVTNANALETERKAAGRLFEVARAHTGKFDVSKLRDNLTAKIQETDGTVRSALLKARNLNVFSTSNAGASAVQLHAARQAIDDQLNRPGVGSNAARLLRDVRSQIDETLKGNVPGMREADQAYSSVMKRKEALEAGREVFRRSYGSPEELAFEIRNMAPAERADFVKGARDSISEIMGTARNDAGAARRELLEKGWNKEKLQILIGKDTATVLSNALDKEAARSNAAQNILGNSRTALRQEARKAFPGGDATPDYKGTSLYGAALQLGNKAFNVFVGNRRRALSLQAAQLLTRKAQDVEPLLQEAQRLAKRRLNVREQIEIVGNALAVGMIASQ